MKHFKYPALKWAWDKTRGFRARILSLCLLGLMRVGAGLSFVWVSKIVVDTATGVRPGGDGMLLRLSILLAALLLGEVCMSLGVSTINTQAQAAMKRRLRTHIYGKLMCSNWEGPVRLHSGDLLNRLNDDVNSLVDVVCSTLPNILIMLAQLLAAFGLLYSMSPNLAVWFVGIAPVFIIASKLYVRKMRSITTEIRQHESDIQANMQEGLQHHAAVQTLECENQMQWRLDDLMSRWYGISMRRLRINVFARGLLRFGFTAGYLTVFIWSIWHLNSGAITFGAMTAFLQLVGRIQGPMSGLSQSISPLVYATSSVDRLMELDRFEEEDKSECVLLPSPVGVRFVDVTFRYSEDAYDVLHDFNHDFAPGSKTVVMGETGAGKSTLAKLVLALLRPQRGSIALYSRDGRTAAAAPNTRCNMVYVPQGNSLLAGTVRDNLLLGNPEATDAQLREALHTAVAEFVYDLPMGLDTVCGELGTGLSEGQAQRIAIARALLRNGSIMLLDEFNSALDESTAALLMQRLHDTRPQSTIIYISHRSNVADYCDEILRIDRQA